VPIPSLFHVLSPWRRAAQRHVGSFMKTRPERIVMFVLTAACLCGAAGCQSSRSPEGSPAFSELPPEKPKLPANEVPASNWSPSIQALHPIKVYWEGGNLVVVQLLRNGLESGKYVISPLSSTGPMGHFAKFTPVDVEGFSPLTKIYDYERGQR